LSAIHCSPFRNFFEEKTYKQNFHCLPGQNATRAKAREIIERPLVGYILEFNGRGNELGKNATGRYSGTYLQQICCGVVYARNGRGHHDGEARLGGRVHVVPHWVESRVFGIFPTL
jgi:hypothetical protein